MYIEKRKAKGKVRYYLGYSFREGGKVHKIRKFLGSDLNEKTLKEREEKAKVLILEEIQKYQIIRDPLKFELSPEEINYLENLERGIPLKLDHLSESDWQRFTELFTYSTNAIEGSELNSKEVKEILEEDKWPDKSKQDIAEAYGVNEAIEFIRKNKEHIALDLIIELHKIVFKNSKQFAGQLRKPGEKVVVMGSGGQIVHEGAPQSRIIGLLKELVDWYEKNRKKYPGIVLAAVVHNQFENIHPFRDGNGRVGRLLLNNILLKHGLPPVNIDLKNRQEYYKALQFYDKEHNLRPMIELILKEYKAFKRILK